MTDVKSDLEQASKDAEAAALARVNADENWFKANRYWLLAVGTFFVLGFILGHLAKL